MQTKASKTEQRQLDNHRNLECKDTVTTGQNARASRTGKWNTTRNTSNARNKMVWNCLNQKTELPVILERL